MGGWSGWLGACIGRADGCQANKETGAFTYMATHTCLLCCRLLAPHTLPSSSIAELNSTLSDTMGTPDLTTCPPVSSIAEVNSILSDTMGILQQFLAASSAAGSGSGSGRMPRGYAVAPPSELQPSDPFR